MVFYNLACPLAELYGTLIINLKTNRNDHLETIATLNKGTQAIV